VFWAGVWHGIRNSIGAKDDKEEKLFEIRIPIAIVTADACGLWRRLNCFGLRELSDE